MCSISVISMPEGGRPVPRPEPRPSCRTNLVVASLEGAIQVTAAGWFLVRAIAMVFDQHLHKAREAQVQTVRFSRVI